MTSMNNDELTVLFTDKFISMKNQLKFKSSLADLDKIFFIHDFILKEGYVPHALSRVICRRIADMYLSWYNYLHSIIFPNPNYMVNLNENQVFNKEEKEEIIILMNKIMAFVYTNNIIGLTKKKAMEAKFIDDSVKLWKSEFLPSLTKLVKKIHKMWCKK